MAKNLTQSGRTEWSLAVAERMCLSKHAYSKKEAKSMLNIFKRVLGRHGLPEAFRIYQCPICDKWHFTKGGKKGKR